MADNPDIQWALDILTPDPDIKPSLYEKYAFLVGTPFTCCVAASLRNKFLNKPLYAGLHVHIISSIIGFGLAYQVQNYVKNYHAKRDQLLRHYITLHPEDFPPPERKTWGEVFDKWVPIR